MAWLPSATQARFDPRQLPKPESARGLIRRQKECLPQKNTFGVVPGSSPIQKLLLRGATLFT